MADDGKRPRALDSGQLLQINRLATAARMVAGLAHELNNVLQVVGGLVELLDDRALPPDAQARIQKIGAQVDKATGVIRQVLTYTREAGRQTGSVELGALAEQALALRRYNIGRAGISATIDAATTPVHVVGDSRALLQVLVNLLVNAEEALADQPERRLRIAVERDVGAIRVVVGDTGHGVPVAISGRIFEPFFTTRTGGRAVGLGLPVARELASQSGGQLTLQDPGPGTTAFVVTWPA